MSDRDEARVRVEPLGPGNAKAWTELFGRAASPCFCRFWHFGGTKNEWLARCAMEPEANAAEAQQAIVASAAEAGGLVALGDDGTRAIGWMKLTPRSAVPKLRGLAIYRALDLGDGEGVFSIGCFLVDPAERRRGIAARLIDAAPAFVAERGGRAIEAYPRHVHETTGARLHDEEAMMGPEALFASRGYVRVDSESRFALAQYPVYRLGLS